MLHPGVDYRPVTSAGTKSRRRLGTSFADFASV
jgi:hypothetical protein